MLQQIFLFELKYRFKRPATYLYFALLFLFMFLNIIYGGGPASEKANLNSPYAISQMLIIISIFGSLMSSAIMGVPVYRDVEFGTKDYFFSFPITEKGYLLGRFLGSFVTLLFVCFGMVLGILLGGILGPMLGLAENVSRFAPPNLWHHVQPYLVFVVPNMLFTGCLFFSLVALTRKVFIIYSGGIMLLIAYLLSTVLTQDLENKTLVDLIDPFGLTTFNNATKYWTPYEQNTLTASLTGHLLYNRLIWMGLGLLVFLGVLFRFDFQKFLAVKLGGKKQKEEARPKARISLADLPIADKVYSSGIFVRQMFSQAWLEFVQIIRDPYFIAIMVGALFFLFTDGWFGSPTYGTPSLPLTYYMIEVKDFNYGLFAYIILIFYTGEVVHRDKSVKYNLISDSLPVPNWAVYGSKFLAIVLVGFVLVNLVILSGVSNQIIKGYFNFEFDKYFTDLYLIEFPEYIELAMLAFFMHIMVNQKFVGHILTIGLWFLLGSIQSFAEINYNLFFFSYFPGYRISDMNGFGHFAQPLFWFHLNWLALGALLLVLGNLFWNRGAEDSFKARWRLMKQRFNGQSALWLSVFTVLWLGVSGFIYYNVSVLNQYQTAEEGREQGANYEKKYKKYEGIPQPKVVDLKVSVDLYPSQRACDVQGFFTLVNKSTKPIDSLHLNMGSPIAHTDIKKLTINGVAPKIVLDDKDLKYQIYRLPRTLQPGDTMKMDIALHAENRGFTNGGFSREIVYNGTFFDLQIFPSMGYAGDRITSDKYRKKYGLPEKKYSLPPQNDAFGLSTLLFNDDADLVTFEGTVSTEPDQIAIMPGYLQKEWTANGRRYFSYKQEGLMDLFFNVCSARYAVKRDAWKAPDGKEVKIAIYYHPGHEYNLDRFIKSTKDALAYNHVNYRPYQYSEMRIIEFPRYAGFAQSFPNTVPYTESFGWVADFSDPDKTDYAYYVTAHEVAHQWWGHQICPSYTRGANQISESMAEYSSLMVMKKEYGEDIMQSRLKYSLDSYLRGRANESKFEETLLDNDTRAYVWYDKGSLVLYALQDLIGEKAMNKALSDFANENAFLQKPPFPTSGKWFAALRKAIPDSLQYFAEDSFEKIALYENRITKAEATKLKGDQYKVKLTVQAKKLYYDKQGKEIATGKDRDYIDIGIFAEEGKNAKGMKKKVPLYLKKHWLKPGEHTLEFVVKGEPKKAGIDPYNKLIDRISDDNVMAVEL